MGKEIKFDVSTQKMEISKELEPGELIAIALQILSGDLLKIFVKTVKEIHGEDSETFQSFKAAILKSSALMLSNAVDNINNLPSVSGNESWNILRSM